MREFWSVKDDLAVRRLFPYKKAIVTFLLLAASVFLMNITGKPENGPSFWEIVLYKCAQPAIELFSAVRQWSEDFLVIFYSKKALLEENKALRQELESLKVLQARLKEAEKENTRLKDLLQFKESSAGEYKVAKVIGRNPQKWFSTLTVSLGTSDGVMQDAPVVSRSGLVGRILFSYDQTSTVLLLSDAESGAGAIINRSRDYGVVLGGHGPDRLVMRFFSRDADVIPGDLVLTSGMGSVYPAGILIGKVIKVYTPKPGLVKECYVKPATDFQHLEEVMVKIK